MGKKRPERTSRRAEERAARQLVRDREQLAKLSPGGSAERPIYVDSSAVIEGRARATPCPQCAGEFRVGDHRSEGPRRVVRVTCTRCHVSRELWFAIVVTDPN